MAEESVITEELKKRIGVEGEPLSFTVEKGHIKRFVEAVGDPNPLWTDEAYARKTKWGGAIAPPMFLLNDGIIDFVDRLMEVPCPLKGLLNGGIDFEFHKPMRPGDIITTHARLADLTEKQGKGGKLLIMAVDMTLTNQCGEVVVKGRHNFIRH